MLTLEQVVKMKEGERIKYFSDILKGFNPIETPEVRVVLDLPIDVINKVSAPSIRQPELIFQYSFKKLCWVVTGLENTGNVELDGIANLDGAF